MRRARGQGAAVLFFWALTFPGKEGIAQDASATYVSTATSPVDSPDQANLEQQPDGAATEQAQVEAQEARKARQAAQAQLEREKQQAQQAQEQEALARQRAQAIAAREQERLFKIQSQQVKLRSQIERGQAQSERLHDQVTDLVQKVEQKLEAERSPAQAQEYEQRVSKLLEQVRQGLQRAMQSRRSRETVSVPVHELPTLRVDQATLEAQRLEIIEENEALDALSQKAVWDTIALRYDDMRALNRTRLALLSELSLSRRVSLTGFTATGWQNVRMELSQMGLELSVRWLRFRERLDRLGQELLKERNEIAWLSAKFLVLALIFRWWRSRANDLLMSIRAALLERRKEFPALEHARVFFWYLIKIRSPVEWWVFGWIIAHFWIPDSWLELSLLWTMYKWIVGASVVVAWLNAFATRGIRRRDRDRDHNKALRLQTLGMLGFTAMGAGLALDMAQRLVGDGALFQWIRRGAWLLAVPITLYLLVRWRPVVLRRCEEQSSVSKVAGWVHQRSSLVGKVTGTLVGAGYLLFQGTKSRLSGLLMQIELFRRASAFLRRRDAEQKSESVDAPKNLSLAECTRSRVFDPDELNADLLDIGPSKRIAKMLDWLDEGRHSLIAVLGERGAGKSSFLARLARDESQEILNEIIDCPKSGLEELYARIEAQVGASIADEAAFEQALSDSQKQAICIDNVHRLVSTSIGGLTSLDEFIGFARRWNKSMSWVMGFGASAWRYTQRARGERAYFDEIVELRPWSEEELARLLDDRCAQAGISPDFSVLRFSANEDDGYTVHRRGHARVMSAEDLSASRRSFYRILWDYSGGNPGIALHAWSQSLFQAGTAKAPTVRLFEKKPIAEVEGVSLPALFTLRSLVLMGRATRDELILGTNLPTQDVTGALRTLRSLGIVERMGPWYRVAWDWCRPVMTVLLRQQLLIK